MPAGTSEDASIDMANLSDVLGIGQLLMSEEDDDLFVSYATRFLCDSIILTDVQQRQR